MKPAALAAGALAALAAAVPARADNAVDILLVLAADVSRSIDEDEFNLQRKGYAAALSEARVLKAITDGPHRAIAVTFIEWSDTLDQDVVVDWTTIGNGEDAAAVAAAILKAPRSFASRTSISGAIYYAMGQLSAAKVTADKRIIDISGDGTNNSGPAVTDARDEAVGAGITINGLAIINTKAGPGFTLHTQPPGGLPEYYRQNVIGGPGAFLLQVDNFDTFADAITRKLVSEIAGVPGGGRSAALGR
ncbi:MAG TPA: DUF1194 domain-containing protein [Stellaceae bacterium]|jgi:hypothetical protein|nr:DUF1194 domain-containing protein [Stellaceae bacterium]